MAELSPKVSIAVPYYDTPKTAYFLSRLFFSIGKQTFQDYEIVLTNEPGMAHNHNAAILKSRGEIIKLMQMDDYFAHPDSLKNIVDNFKGEWMIVGCAHIDEGSPDIFNEHHPQWTDDIYTGNNKLGGLSTLVIKNDTKMLLDEDFSWVVDCDLYRRYKDKFGLPDILDEINVIVDVGEHRLSNTLSDEFKSNEHEKLIKRYDPGAIYQGIKYVQ